MVTILITPTLIAVITVRCTLVYYSQTSRFKGLNFRQFLIKVKKHVFMKPTSKSNQLLETARLYFFIQLLTGYFCTFLKNGIAIIYRFNRCKQLSKQKRIIRGISEINSVNFNAHSSLFQSIKKRPIYFTTPES